MKYDLPFYFKLKLSFLGKDKEQAVLCWSVGNKARRFGDTTIQRPGKDDPDKEKSGTFRPLEGALRLHSPNCVHC